ncbi:MAG: glycosyltransferase family 2 protein [Mycobacteriales bacterium]
MPALSVVTATFNRAARLERLLEALSRQSLTELEVIVVDDRSTDGTWDLLQASARRYGWLRPLQMPQNGGPARARNVGWQATRSPFIAFTDDDCVPDPEWAQCILAAFSDPAVGLVQGRTVPDPLPYRWRLPFDHSVRVDAQSAMFETCNLGVRRDLLQALGGFDESFPFAFGEDADFGWRALERGAGVAWLPDAVVTHDLVRRGFRDQLRGERRRISLVTVVRKHPGLRGHITHRYFYDPTHERLLLSYLLAGSLVLKPMSVLRWAALAGSVTWYGRLRFVWSITQGPRKKWPLWMIQLFILDTVDMARLMRQSAREKTLVI